MNRPASPLKPPAARPPRLRPPSFLARRTSLPSSVLVAGAVLLLLTVAAIGPRTIHPRLTHRHRPPSNALIGTWLSPLVRHRRTRPRRIHPGSSTATRPSLLIGLGRDRTPPSPAAGALGLAGRTRRPRRRPNILMRPGPTVLLALPATPPGPARHHRAGHRHRQTTALAIAIAFIPGYGRIMRRRGPCW